ncbi:hypothetical protein [Bradyrhizobium arachidis]|uniref:hypothetical protein n=1 Tax=Bradyrhizobium arachidis TaxID=858423 RepID=UPI00216268D1|nr:hypothetical protein [Bradyrhizobium arachidis]UVO27595.1 hypothetical protein KUF59_34730 [Bradyrhizobium arachidis]
MATEKQIAANRKNAARSTGPRTISGKARSRMNALRHGLAATLEDHGGGTTSDTGLDLEALSERIGRIEVERGKLTFEIETQLWEGNGSSKEIDDRLRQLGALERYAKRSASALRKK